MICKLKTHASLSLFTKNIIFEKQKQKRAQNFLQDIKLKNINITNNLPLVLLSSFNSLLQIGHMVDILLK